MINFKDVLTEMLDDYELKVSDMRYYGKIYFTQDEHVLFRVYEELMWAVFAILNIAKNRKQMKRVLGVYLYAYEQKMGEEDNAEAKEVYNRFVLTIFGMIMIAGEEDALVNQAKDILKKP